MTTITTAAPTLEELQAVGINRIIERAKYLLSQPHDNTWKEIYEPAKVAIAELIAECEVELPAGEYERAIDRLTEELGI